MLTLLHEIIWPDGRLVTFNGRTFDIPLLSDRYIMSRLRTHVTRLPNLDLLHPARRLWKRRLASCRLSALEVDILGLNRASNDVPGHLIPYLYREYLRTGNGHDMIRVLYHNEQDILSMVSLGVTLARAFDEPEAPTLHIEDRLSLARWYAKRGMLAECETAYRLALDECPDEQTRYDALAGLSEMLKRIGRAQEAISLWEYIADLKFDTFGHEELAKYYEWQTKDLHTALLWTESGIALTETWRPGLRRTEAVRSLEARRSRLIRKIKARPG
jgi:tetratricopeptide (TPR) repeat protein